MATEPERFTVWHGLLLVEGTALLIALVTPITPSKTGSDRGLGHLFFPEPSYLQEVFVYFVATNLLLGLLAVLFVLWIRFSKK